MSSPERPHRRYPLTTLALLILGCAGLLYVGFSLAVQSRMPSDGVLLTEPSSAGTSVSHILSPEQDVLRVGDEILALDGRTVWEWVDRALRGGSPIEWRVGQIVTYQVRRAGNTLELPVTLRPFPVLNLLFQRFGAYLLAMAALLVGGYVLLARPADPAARLLFIATVSVALPLLLHFQSAILFTPGLFLADYALKTLGMCLIFSGVLHLFLIFPTVKPWLRGRERWLLGLHIVNPLLSLALGWFLGANPVDRLLLIGQSVYWIGLLMLVAAVASVVHTYITVSQPTARSQIRWVAWGSLIGMVPFLLFTGIPEVISGRAILDIEITSFFLVVVPISIAIAVARYRLFDIDTVIHRSLVYTILMALSVGLYLVLVTVLNAVVLRLTGHGQDSLVVFVSTLITATAFWALRGRLVRRIAPLFYRARVDPATLLTEMSERLSATLRLDDIAAVLAVTIPARLGAVRGGLMVLSEDGTRLEMASGASGASEASQDDFTLPVAPVQDGWAGHLGEPIQRSAPAAWVPDSAWDVMDQRQAELAIPLLAGDQIAGLWSLGARRSGLPYTTAEVHTLRTLARQAAINIQNARLVRRLELHSQELEEMVRRRTQALEDERNWLDAILRHMADGLLVVGADRWIMLVNPALEEMVGRPAAELLDRPADQVLALPDLATAIARALAQPGQVQVHDLPIGDRVCRASMTALGDRSVVIILLRDVTHEAEVDRMKSEFVSAVSHELRTPLTAILGFARLIHRALDRTIIPVLPPDAEIQRATERIEGNLDVLMQEGVRLTTLINDVLDIADLDQGKIEWHDQPTDLLVVARQVVESVRQQAQEKDIALLLQIPRTLQPVQVDPERISQVISNLLANALKFTERGQIIVRVQPLVAGTTVRRWRAPAGGAVQVSVSDTGVGIAPEAMDKLFQRFYQGMYTLQNKPKGTGLGLAICQEIVHHYGGIIWAESTPDVGSTFHFTLPVS